MGRPSDQVLAWLRKIMTDRNVNTASLAERVSIPRARMRKLLSGAEPMLVDELLAISQALEISPADMGMPDLEEGDQLAESPAPPGATGGTDPFGNHPAQLMRMAFDLGCDVQFVCDAALIQDSGVPRQVLDAHRGRPLAIRLDAAYHAYNEPRFDEAALTLVLSFDALYTCVFPWRAFGHITFFPAPWEGVTQAEEHPEPEPESEERPRPHLRLVDPDE
ncbi:MAG: helix-turn-helix transcriptional regulator [Alphaproteobacteria bacterium]|nr:helix-turn-helix transcriptional regulator [Alphaproteobacteria bacterium]